MLDSNLNEIQKSELITLVPNAFNDPDEHWRIIPNTLAGMVYSISSKRDIVVKHTFVDSMGRICVPRLTKIFDDQGTLCTTVRRASKDLSIYLEHLRYDAFPELNITKTLDDDCDDAIDVPYEGVDWCGRLRQSVHIIPVIPADMAQVRQFYPEDLPREIWAYVPGTNRKYVVSSQGRGVILKRYRVTGTILKAQKWQLESGGKDCDYYSCTLRVGDKELGSVSHTQILRSFVPKPGSEYETNHINGDRHCNILDNLEWVTRQENSDHYNKSPEMAYKRAIGYKKISDYGKAHQREIQNRPEVNAKRSATLKREWREMTEEQRNLRRYQNTKEYKEAKRLGKLAKDDL